MEKNKNVLIGGLLAIVLVMAVGYAAFATQLNINGTAEITSKWDVHMVDGTTTPASTMGTTPTGTLTVAEGGLAATFSASLTSPGDTVTFTVPVKNVGTLDASLSGITLSSDTEGMVVDNVGLTAVSKDGNIKYTVTSPGTATLTKETGTANLVVKAEYVNKADGQTNAQNVSAQLKVALTYAQA